MTVIKKLTNEVINQIKAGEVVERPASAVKEIVENSLDAGATAITIELLDGGKQLIRITDNGCGMEPEDLELALERHATSKLTKVADLDVLSTMGFRGEAIPSIASVSKFSIKSRTTDSDIGYEIEVNAGIKQPIKQVVMQVGTCVTVKDLFFCTPARLKFLRSTGTEFAHIHDFLQGIALSRFNISIKFTHNGKEVFSYRTQKSLAERFQEIFSVEVKEYIPLKYSKDDFKITGFVNLPEYAKSSPSVFLTFVNGRYVKDKVVRAGIIQAYSSLLMKGLVPSAVVFVNVDPKWVDINAHPAKTEVRFYDPARVQELLSQGIQDNLKKLVQDHMLSRDYTQSEPIKNSQNGYKYQSTSGRNSSSNSQSSAVYSVKNNSNSNTRSNSEINKSDIIRTAENVNSTFRSQKENRLTGSVNIQTKDEIYPEIAKFEAKVELNKESIIPQSNFTNTPKTEELFNVKTNALTSAIYLGQYNNCFLLLQVEKELWIIDQHALHERILYEEICQKHQNNPFPMQELLTPILIPLPKGVANILIENQDVFLHLGFKIEELNATELALHSFPSFLDMQKIPTLFDEIMARILIHSGAMPTETHPLTTKIKSFSAEELSLLQGSSSKQKVDIFHSCFATMACHTAIRAGEELGAEQVRHLLSRTGSVDFFANCPHGRPVMRKFTEKDVASWFLRI